MTIIGQQTVNDPVRSGHQGGIDSGNINPLYMDQHFGAMERRFLQKSFFRAFLNIRPVRGTDTLTNPRMGTVQLQKLQRGIRATDHSPTFDNISIKVDTIILARSTEFVLEEFQASYQTRTEIGDEQGKELGKFFDEACVAQAVKASQVTVVHPDGSKDGGWEGLTPANIERSAPEGHRGGTCIVLAGANDHKDPDLLEVGMRRVITSLKKKEVEPDELVWLIDHDTHEVLQGNQNLIHKDINGFNNGSFAMATVERVAGVMLWPNNRMPDTVNVRGTSDHHLSNAGNNWSYNNTANDTKCVACLMHPKALLAGETIPATTEVFRDPKDKMWYIDAWMSFAVTPNRAEVAGGVFQSSVA